MTGQTRVKSWRRSNLDWESSQIEPTGSKSTKIRQDWAPPQCVNERTQLQTTNLRMQERNKPHETTPEDIVRTRTKLLSPHISNLLSCRTMFHDSTPTSKVITGQSYSEVNLAMCFVRERLVGPWDMAIAGALSTSIDWGEVSSGKRRRSRGSACSESARSKVVKGVSFSAAIASAGWREWNKRLTSTNINEITDQTGRRRGLFPLFTLMSYRQLSAGKEGDHNTETMNARDAKLHRSKRVTVT